MQPHSDDGAAAGATSVKGIPNFDGVSLFAFADVDLPAGDELYDRIMGAIEPELLSKNVGTLKAKYADETPEEKAVRAARYEKAYAEYDKQYAEYQVSRDTTMLRNKTDALKSLEDGDKHVDHSAMQDLEQQIFSA